MSAKVEHSDIVGKRIKVSCDLDAARQACLDIKEFLAAQGVSGAELSEWELVLAEGINNAVEYACEANSDLPVEIDVFSSDDELSVRVHDKTKGFEWPSDAALPDMESEGGRGIYLIQSLSNFSDYRIGAHGNTLYISRERKDPSKPTTKETGGTEALVGTEELQETIESLEVTMDAMTEELSSCYESLSAIFHFSSELGQAQDTRDFARRLLDHVMEIVEANWFVFRQFYTSENVLRVLSASEEAFSLEDLSLSDGGDRDGGVELRAVTSRQDEWLSAGDSVTATEPLKALATNCHVIVHPIYLNEELLGVLSVGRSAEKGEFKAAQISFINTFAEFLGIQIVNVGYEQERISKGIFTRELEIARNIQRSLLPDKLPMYGGFELAASCDSAREVGGDFYDVISLDGGCFLVVIADVMGKGIPAALFAAILRSLIRALPEHSRNPGKLLKSVNRIIHGDLERVDMFITAQVVFVDPEQSLARVANAGHCPALFVDARSSSVDSVCPDGMPIGVLEDSEYEESTMELGELAKIVVYTDGITEAMNEAQEQFGDDRFAAWLRSHAGMSGYAEGLKSDLLNTVKAFMGTAAPRDDMTFIVASQKGTK